MLSSECDCLSVVFVGISSNTHPTYVGYVLYGIALFVLTCRKGRKRMHTIKTKLLICLNMQICVYIYVCVCVCVCVCVFSMAQQPLMGQGLLNAQASRPHSDTARLVGLVWMSGQTDAETSTWQHTTLTTGKHLRPRRVLSPQSQHASGRNPTA